MNRASPHGGVFAASNRPSPLGSSGSSNRASPLGSLLLHAGSSSSSLHLAKPSVLPASRHSFPARPGFRAGRRKIPFVATSRIEEEANVEASALADMDRTEPDAALELVRNWNQCLEVRGNMRDILSFYFGRMSVNSRVHWFFGQ